MKPLHFAVILLISAACSNSPAQHKVHMRNMYERLICVVPMAGAGTLEDPRRPLYAPVPPARTAEPSQAGIVAYAFIESDDGQFALVEFVARDREAFRQILEDKRTEVKLFEKGKTKKADIEQEFRKHKKNFDPDRLVVALP